MKYSEYKVGLKNLRRILLTNDKQFLGQFGKIDHSRNGSSFSIIWNAKTNNVVAAMNRRGVIFVRENSIYSGQLLNSTKRTVVKGNNLRRFRNVSRFFKMSTEVNMYTEKSIKKLLKNNDKPGTVYLFRIPETENGGMVLSNVKEMLARTIHEYRKDLKNTSMSISNITVTRENTQSGAGFIISLEIADHAEEIARQEHEHKIKTDILEYLVQHYDEFVENSFVNNAYNPLYSSVTLEIDGVKWSGKIDGRDIRLIHEGLYSVDDTADKVRLGSGDNIPEPQQGGNIFQFGRTISGNVFFDSTNPYRTEYQTREGGFSTQEYPVRPLQVVPVDTTWDVPQMEEAVMAEAAALGDVGVPQVATVDGEDVAF